MAILRLLFRNHKIAFWEPKNVSWEVHFQKFLFSSFPGGMFDSNDNLNCEI